MILNTLKSFVLGGCILFLGINALVILIGHVNIHRDNQELSPAPIALVLGAGILDNGEMSPYLQDRADATIELYRANLVENIIVSGDNSRNQYNEVEPVKKYFLERGVFSGDIYLDHAGFDTYDSLYRARDIFDAQEIIVISQYFHLHRSVFIGTMLGLDIQGYPSTQYNGTRGNHIREMFARVKSVLDIIVHSSPTYLGQKIKVQ